MRALLAISLLSLAAATAHAEAQLAGDPPPVLVVPPPPPPPPAVVAVVRVPPRPRPPLSDRWTLTPATGVLWMQLHGVTQEGMLLQPTLTRTFDRLELQADYMIANVAQQAAGMPGTLVHRLGGSAHVQAGRIRLDRTMSMDLVAQGGVGLELLVGDRMPTVARPDFSLGVGLRMITDIDARPAKRVLFGMELGARLLVVPRATGHADLGFLVAFGIPIGR